VTGGEEREPVLAGAPRLIEGVLFKRDVAPARASGKNEVCFERSVRRPKRRRQTRALLTDVTTVPCSRAWSECPCET